MKDIFETLDKITIITNISILSSVLLLKYNSNKIKQPVILTDIIEPIIDKSIIFEPIIPIKMNNTQNQITTTTKFDRYPHIFKKVCKIIDPNKEHKILSFGCSTGLEIQTLNKIYFKKSKIDGLDIKKYIIDNLSKSNTNNNIKYYSDINKLLLNSYDIIFCMSVLLNDTYNLVLNKKVYSGKPYTFELFNNNLNNIDKLLKVNGYLCIYNTHFIFSESSIFKKYKIININTCKSNDTAINLNKHNKVVNNYPYVLFQKIRL